MKKKTLIIVLIMLICTIVGIKTYKTMGTEVEEIKKKEKHNNYLTFYVKQDDGNYVEQSGNTFPTGTYKINTSMTKCEDQFGEKVTPSFSMNNGSVTVTSTRTVYCTLYMDKCKIPDIIKESYPEADFSQINACELTGDLYRYQGTSNVNNYLCFGTNEKDKCLNNPDKYMYRVIGLTPTGQMKIVKDTVLIEDTVNLFFWNYHNNTPDYCDSAGNDCTWPDVLIYKRLNGISNGTKPGKDGDTNLYLNRTDDYYDLDANSLSNSDSERFPNVWNELIEEHEWKYGDITEESVANSFNGDKLFEIENNFTSSIKAKIGLLYIHDFSYAYPGGNPGSSTIAKNVWMNIYDGFYSELYITRYAGSPYGSPYFCNWFNSNIFYNNGLDGTSLTGIRIRPVFYTNMKLCNSKDGTSCYYLKGIGTSFDPLRIVYYN